MMKTATRSATTRRLADLRMADVAEVGGKAASLGELIAAGVHVPDGVVLPAAAADMTSEERRWLSGAGAWDLGAGPFAVRSSAIAEDGAERSFAGMFESVLNVSADDVPAAVDRCLASASAARVADVRGCRWRPDGRHHPTDGCGRPRPVWRSPQIRSTETGAPCVVTAVRGLGERLVSGEAIGDEWVVRGDAATARRQPEHAIDRRQAVQIANEARRIAAARGMPQDIEWAIDAEGALWILQARPMTALPPDVSWEAPAPGAYTRMLRFGEWIGEPVTPLFESWLLTAHGGPHARALPGVIGQIAPRPLPRRGQRLVLLLDQLHLRRRPAPQPSRHARDGRSRAAPHRGDHSADCSAQLPDLRADVARGPSAALPGGRRRCRAARGGAAGRRASRSLIDELADAGRRVLRLDRGAERCGATRWR